MNKSKITLFAVVMSTLLCSTIMNPSPNGKPDEPFSFGPDFPLNNLDFDTILDKIDRCCDGIANLKILEGAWRLFMVGKEPPPGTSLDVKLRLKHEIVSFDEQRLLGSLTFADGRMEFLNMTQIGHYNLLINAYYSGNPDKPKIMPVILIGYDQSRYLSLWQAGDGTTPGTSGWLIFVRPSVNDLEHWELGSATYGLDCLGLVDEKELHLLID